MLAELCRRHGIRKLSLFGSELKGSARPESDIDLCSNSKTMCGRRQS
jgi:predicted nucleotidyltransferase